MDLEGVKRKLTEGYARINKVKNSTSKIETCRTVLKTKADKALSEVKTMMNSIAQKLYQLQQSIESTIENTVAEREMQLDIKKKEIHDGYANLVKICVEADNVLRGRNVDLLGRSCQRLFCKFEAANLKLDAAEKFDTDGLVGFEFKDDSKQFLSSAYVARLQHFNSYGRLAEIDEFWLDCENTDDYLDTKTETTYTVSKPCTTDCSSIRPATVRRSPERSSSFSPKQYLETIQEVPEDASPTKGDKTKTEVQTPAEVVRICEEDLYLDKCRCCSDRDMNIYSPDPGFVPPPPGFSRLKEPGLEMNHNLQQYAHLQKNLGFAVNPKWGICRNSQTNNAVWSMNGYSEGSVLSKVSQPKAHFPNGAHSKSVCATFKPVRFQSSSSQHCEINQKFSRERVVSKSSDRCRESEDFVWDSDDSVDLHSAGSCPSYHPGPVGQCKEELNESTSQKRVPQMTPVTVKTDVEEKSPGSESDLEDERKVVFSSLSSLSSSGQQSVDSSNENNDSSQEQSACHSEPKQNGYAHKDMTASNIKKEQEETADKEKKLVVTHIDVQRKEDGTCVKTEESSPGKKTAPSPDRGGLAKTADVPRPKKTKRLDLGHMLLHTGGGLFMIQAKCIEKIRGDFDHPIGVCTNSKGDVIVADTGNHIIKVCNNGRVIKKFGSDLKMRRPSAVVVNKKDEIFVKDDNCLYHFDAEGQLIKTMGKRAMNAPYGLGMTKEGKLIVVDASYSSGRIHQFQQDGSMETYPYQPLRNRREDSKCRFLAVHGDNVMTSDLGCSCLYLTNQKGELMKTIGRRGKRFGELHEPAGVAVDTMGNWIVADSKNHRVQVFAENGCFMAALNFTGESIRRPSGIHLTNDGLLYVINYLESIIKVFKLGVS